MQTQAVIDTICAWIKTRVEEAGQKGLVIGVSGGIDSAVTSTLCAKTRLPTICLNMPIAQAPDQYDRANEQIAFLHGKFPNVSSYTVDLTSVFRTLVDSLGSFAQTELALVNSRSRLRMIALYAYANSSASLVCGTGNKVEDFGVGFFTKYGDGGVDICPIGDLVKSEVFQLGASLGLPASIQAAAPTDGLWGTDRTDEQQIGATYDELEWAMAFIEARNRGNIDDLDEAAKLNPRQKEVLDIYRRRHRANAHKMAMPPICDLGKIKN